MPQITLCYLVVNQIKHLPIFAIQTALLNTKSRIVIGYINEEDIRDLPQDSRITTIKLRSHKIESEDYASYDGNAFFEIVKLKWQLLSKLQEISETEINCYIDLDVLILKDFSETLIETFSKNSQTRFLVQDDTVRPDQPQLCMGLLAFRNNPDVEANLRECAGIHERKSVTNERIGDDEVITEFYNDSSALFLLLPQGTFPTGRFLGAYVPGRNFLGVKMAQAYIYHANYIVGTRKKSLTLYQVAKRNGIGRKLLRVSPIEGLSFQIEFYTRRLKTYLQDIVFETLIKLNSQK